MELKKESHLELQQYFQSLFEKIKAPDDNTPPPEIYFVEPLGSEDFAAFVMPQHPRYVFWNPNFFKEVKYKDIDLYVFAHELRHFTAANQSLSDARSKEYDADAMAVAEGLFRIGYRQQDGTPQPAIAHPETLIQFLKSYAGEYREEYLNGNTGAAGIKVLYAKERQRRMIPVAPEKKEVSKDFYSDLHTKRSKFRNKKTKKGKQQFGAARSQINSAKSRIRGDHLGALIEIELRRQTQYQFATELPFSLLVEFGGTFEEIYSPVKDLSHVISRGGSLGKDKLKKVKKLARQVFQEFRLFPMDFFQAWGISFSNEETYKRLSERNFRSFFFKYNSKHFDSIANLYENQWPTASQINQIFELRYGIDLDLETTLFASSRLFQKLLSEPVVNLQDAPAFGFFLRLLIHQAEIDFKGSWKPRAIGRIKRKYKKQFQQSFDSAQFHRDIIKLFQELDGSSLLRLSRHIVSPQFEKLFPGLKNTLRSEFSNHDNLPLRVALNGNGPQSAKKHFQTLLAASSYQEYLSDLIDLDRTNFFFNDGDYNKYLTQLLTETTKRQQTFNPAYIQHLDLALSYYKYSDISLYKIFYTDKDDLEKIEKFEKSSKEYSKFQTWITQMVQNDPIKFLDGWINDPQLDLDRSLILYFTDWKKVFAKLNVDQMQIFIDTGSKLFRLDRFKSSKILVSFQKRVLELVTSEEPDLSSQALKLAISVVNQSQSASPESQQLMNIIMSFISSFQGATEAGNTLKVIESILPSHFTDTTTVVELYANAFAVHTSGRREDFKSESEDRIVTKLEELKKKFLDPALGQQIMNRLAKDYHAKPSQKKMFRYSTSGNEHLVGSGAEGFHIWNEIFRELSDSYTLNLINFLRGNGHLKPQLQKELSLHLLKANIIVSQQEVGSYLKRRFNEISPFYRASVFQVALDGTTELLDKATYRNKIFQQILRSVDDQQTRRVFIDLWDAGMKALPRALRSLVLSIVLSESGTTGRPEKALVTLFSNLGPLEQKFGQALAFANLPESYRQELRNLWDNAQELGWWDAWELIDAQHGDILTAGYTLSRVLHSGSTEAFLEIEHEITGQLFVIPVYRDGIQQSVNVGAHQLRVFANHLARKNKKKYGFLPLLVEDSVRTMALEINSKHKRTMTEVMKEKYQQAAIDLGGEVNSDGYILLGGFVFSHLGFSEIKLQDGRTLYAQPLANGVPMRSLEGLDSDQYRRLTENLLKLEYQVLSDSSAPVDKDRMPGQNIYNVEHRLNYILDHGQAKVIDSEIHKASWNFVKLSFSGHIQTMNSELERLTGISPQSNVDLDRFVRGVDRELRALTYLSEVAETYLALPDGDRSKEKFFDLVHGVRATLRLLQWETSEGISLQSERLRSEIADEMSTTEKAQFVAAEGFKKITNSLGVAKSWLSIGVLSRFWQSLRMEVSYRNKEVPHQPEPLTCTELMNP